MTTVDGKEKPGEIPAEETPLPQTESPLQKFLNATDQNCTTVDVIIEGGDFHFND